MANEFELVVAPGAAAGEYDVRVIRAASGGSPRESTHLDVPRLLRLRPSLEQAVLASAAHARGGPVPEVERPLRDAGQELFEGLFVGSVRETYRASGAVAHERGSKLRVVLHLEAAELAALPWEAMWDPEARAYLCRKEPLVRNVPSPYTPDPLPVSAPLSILAVVASPRGLPPIDVERERQHLDEALAGAVADGRISIDWLQEATWDRLQERLLGGTWHVLHFIGHGDFDPILEQGRIALVSEEGGRADWVEASRLADLLNEADPTPRLVVLNSCSSGRSGAQDVLSGTAAALVNSGISAVAAMQFPISDPAAVAFPRGFYRALAVGKSVDSALSSGRVAILGRGESLEWVTPVLYMRGGASELFSLDARRTAARGVAEGKAGRPVGETAPVAPAGSPPVAAAPPRSVTDDPRYREASEAREVGDWDRAIALLESVRADHPGVDMPELGAARRKRDLAAWWNEELSETADDVPTRPGEAVPATGVWARTPSGSQGRPPAREPVDEAQPPGTRVPVGPTDHPPVVVTGGGGAPRKPSTLLFRRRGVLVALAALAVILGVGAAWLIRAGDSTRSTGPAPSIRPSASQPQSPSPGPTTPSAVAASPNLSAWSLSSETPTLLAGEEKDFEFRVQNKSSASREAGPTAGGIMTVVVRGDELGIKAGRPLARPAEDCEVTSVTAITCSFGSLEANETASFSITFVANQAGRVGVASSATPQEGGGNPPIERDFEVLGIVPPDFVKTP